MTDETFYQELGKVSGELWRTPRKEDDKQKFLDAYENILSIRQEASVWKDSANSVKVMGLFSADGWGYDLTDTGISLEFLNRLLEYFSRCMEEGDVTELAKTFYYSHYDMDPVDKMLCLMYFRGALMLKDDDCHDMIQDAICSMIPLEYRDDAQKVYSDVVHKSWEQHKKEGMEHIEFICADNEVPLDYTDHSLTNEVQLVVDSIDNEDILMMRDDLMFDDWLKVLAVVRGRTRKKIIECMREDWQGYFCFDLYNFLAGDDGRVDACLKFLSVYENYRQAGRITLLDKYGTALPPEQDTTRAVLQIWKEARNIYAPEEHKDTDDMDEELDDI